MSEMTFTDTNLSSENTAGPSRGACISQATSHDGGSTATDKPVVVGLYGISGSGKTYLLSRLKQELGELHFTFYEGSEVIAAVVPGGLAAFQDLADSDKARWRQLAIETIGKECADSGRVAVVTGHFMFWPEGDEVGCRVCTPSDLQTFTHIVYLDVAAEEVLKRRLGDTQKDRPRASVDHLRKWLQLEKTELRQLCRDHNILFSLVPSSYMHSEPVSRISSLLTDFRLHDEKHNAAVAEASLEEVLVKLQKSGPLETLLVLDADKTLAEEDTGTLFWEIAAKTEQLGAGAEAYPLKTLFSSPLGYSYSAFRQATLLYEEVGDEETFDNICERVASEVTMHPEFVSLLQLVGRQEHVGAVIVSCGIRRVWEKVLERESLGETVKVIGGGRIADGFVVTADVKAELVARLRSHHQLYVWAFGDSVLDLPMFHKADQAIVVVGEERTRSKSMEAALLKAIDTCHLRVRQVLLPSHAAPRLDTVRLPQIYLGEQEFIDAILCRRSRKVLHATDRSAAKLLMTPMRDAQVAGPSLREAHRKVGWYLATEYLPEAIGVEEYAIPHVQGHHTSGYRLFNERHTCVVALMRGGEPMALGVNDAFPLAMFIHAGPPEDLKPHHIQTQGAVLLVDSVVNTGKSVVEFIHHIRCLDATIRIVVIAGVVQSQSIVAGDLAEVLSRDGNLSIVTLRLSDNRFTGRGTTDTGNRLFNTTHVA